MKEPCFMATIGLNRRLIVELGSVSFPAFGWYMSFLYWAGETVS